MFYLGWWVGVVLVVLVVVLKVVSLIVEVSRDMLVRVWIWVVNIGYFFVVLWLNVGLLVVVDKLRLIVVVWCIFVMFLGLICLVWVWWWMVFFLMKGVLYYLYWFSGIGVNVF